MPPVVSVIITSDYEVGSDANQNQLRACLAALARQDVQEPVEFLFVESAVLDPALAAELTKILTGLKIVTVPEPTAAGLKNAGVGAAAAEIVAFVDGDCITEPDWIRELLRVIREHPEVSAVTGRTHYGSRTRLDRIMALLTRSYLDRGEPGYTRHVAINNAAFRRPVILAYPCIRDGAHMSLLQAAAMIRDGHRVFFEPRLAVRHAYEGWASEREIRRSLGYGVIKTRLIDARIPYASLARLGYLSVPLFAGLRALHGCWNCVRNRRSYGVTWYELPAAFALALITAMMEVPGMLCAVRRRPLQRTAFR